MEERNLDDHSLRSCIPSTAGGGSTILLKCQLSGRLVSFNEPLITDLWATSSPGSLS